MGESTHNRIREGSPSPRGAAWDGKGVNFSLFSANATKVEVCLFDDKGEKERARADLKKAVTLKDTGPMHNGAGWSYFNLEDYEQAQRDAESLFKV